MLINTLKKNTIFDLLIKSLHPPESHASLRAMATASTSSSGRQEGHRRDRH